MTGERKAVFAFLGEDRSLGKTLRGVGKDAETAHGHLSKLQKTVVGFGAALAGGVAAKKIFDFGKSSVDAYTSAAKAAGAMQRVIGGTVEDASRLGFAAHETGLDVDVLTKSMGLFAKNIVGNSKAFHAFGVEVKDQHGGLKTQSVILGEVADKFAKMPNGPLKSAEALKLFGRQGLALIPLLNKGSAGIKEFGAEADKLGLTMSTKDVAAVKAYTMQQRHMKASFEGLKITLGRSLFPIFTAWSDRLARDTPKIVAWAKSHLPALQHGFRRVADGLGSLLTAGEGLAKDVQPFFQFIGRHPKLFAQIAADAAVLAVSMKAISLAKGAAGALSGVAGAVLGGGKGPGGALGVQKVYVVNMGPGLGGEPGLPGGRGGKGLKFIPPWLPQTARGLAGIGSVLLTSGDQSAAQLRAMRSRNGVTATQEQLIAMSHGAGVGGGFFSRQKAGYSDALLAAKSGDKVAVLKFLQQYGDKTKQVSAALRVLAHDPGVVRALHAQAAAADRSQNAVTNLITGGLIPLDSQVRHLPKSINMTLNVHTRLDALGRKLISTGDGNFYTQGRAGGLTGPANVRGATGGIVTRPTMALIGEAGPEMVVPLNRTPGSRALPGGMGRGDIHITIENNGTVVGSGGMKQLAQQIRAELADASRRGQRLLP